VTQREVGVDTDSFAQGLKAALRQDPDVVLIGELRDAATLDMAMKAAETGHVLLSTMDTPDVATTLARIVATFPPEEQESARVRLADSLHAIVSQRLLTRTDGKGRVAALEVLVATPEIRELLRDRNRVGEIRDLIAQGREKNGSQTFEQHLQDLLESGVVTAETARAAAGDPAGLETRVKESRKASRSPSAAA